MGQVVVGGLERGGVGVWGRVDRGGGKNQGGRSRGVRMGGKPNQSLSASAHVASDAAASIIHSTRPTVRNHFLDGSSQKWNAFIHSDRTAFRLLRDRAHETESGERARSRRWVLPNARSESLAEILPPTSSSGPVLLPLLFLRLDRDHPVIEIDKRIVAFVRRSVLDRGPVRLVPLPCSALITLLRPSSSYRHLHIVHSVLGPDV